MKEPNIILFGEMGAGKDTVAGILKEHYGHKIIKLGAGFKPIVEQLNYQNLEKRALYQNFGQSCRLIFGEDVWNSLLYNKIECELYSSSFVIADARQTNELKFWVEKDFQPVGVVAPIESRIERLIYRDREDQQHRFNHETEEQARISVKNCKYIIKNDSDLYNLVDQVYDIMYKIKYPKFTL